MNGKIYLVGIGPGGPENITPKALDKLKRVSVVIGHQKPLNSIKALINGKEIIARDMTPIERARLAIEEAERGRDVAIVSIGDPGVYAIGSTFLNYIKENGLSVPVEVIPGITLANIAASLLGCPLGHDFATISLADLATEWDAIKRRLESAASSDFVIALYNPRGRVEDDRLRESLDTLMTFRKATTPVGIVTNAAGDDERVQITTLGQVSADEIDINAMLIIGNSETLVYDGKMITPRKYKEGVGY